MKQGFFHPCCITLLVIWGLCLLNLPLVGQTAPTAQRVDLLVIGRVNGGSAATIQSAGAGARTLLVEEGPWLDGKHSAVGLSATDGNHELPSALW